MSRLFLFSLFFYSSLAFPQGFTTPEAVIQAQTRLINSDCKLELQKKYADLHSEKMLKALAEPVVSWLAKTKNRDTDVFQSFDKNIPQAELERMSPRDIFAHQLLHACKQAPPEWLFTKADIVSKEVISDNEVQFVIKRYGLTADPEHEEESLVTLVKEEGGWKIER